MELKALLVGRAWSLARWVGLDRAIFYTVVARGWSALAGPLTVLLVAHFLTAEEQGFYYTFSSITALQVFFELGLAFVIMQSVSHEKAHLEWTAEGTLTGDPRAKARLASLFRLALKWYFVIGLLVFSLLAVVGFAFFRSYTSGASAVQWQVPWFLVVSFVGAGLMLVPLYGVLEGSGKIADVARLNVMQAVAGSVAIWVALSAHSKLYAAPALALSSILTSACYMLPKKRRKLFEDLLRTPIPPGSGVSWRRDILPFQWRISVSWLSGYFIFQLATPVLFRFHGPVEAGRMGMTMRIVDSVLALGLAWISTKAAPFGGYIAKRDFLTLDRVFWKACWQSITVVVLAGIAVMGLYFFLQVSGAAFINRMLGPLAVCLLLGNAVINCFIFNQGTYLRAHKQEPLLFNSLLGAVLVPAVIYFFGRPYGGLGIAAGLFAGGLFIGLPLTTLVFYRKKREWHLPPND